MSDKNKYNKIGGNFFAGFMFLGIAIGFLLGHTVVGSLAGLGIGFIIMGLLQLKND
ncbi:MAG: hypothetical protein ISR90_05655 [Candidatus Marinimicrobia bacterium]|nr:hypothetical protein [Candidatus Neomarinimicrobiota bacterium]MBL7023518.1 hypothetical protein [Candidatus Neomarinimicrobiota bacterium]MBL7109420.1 hypothetical protein [Candidatus Neomarinimicrobiota bacterium]